MSAPKPRTAVPAPSDDPVYEQLRLGGCLSGRKGRVASPEPAPPVVGSNPTPPVEDHPYWDAVVDEFGGAAS